jgi:hypothetical protein
MICGSCGGMDAPGNRIIWECQQLLLFALQIPHTPALVAPPPQNTPAKHTGTGTLQPASNCNMYQAPIANEIKLNTRRETEFGVAGFGGWVLERERQKAANAHQLGLFPRTIGSTCLKDRQDGECCRRRFLFSAEPMMTCA